MANGARIKKEVVGSETTIYIGPHLEKNVTTGEGTPTAGR